MENTGEISEEKKANVLVTVLLTTSLLFIPVASYTALSTADKTPVWLAVTCFAFIFFNFIFSVITFFKIKRGKLKKAFVFIIMLVFGYFTVGLVYSIIQSQF